MRQITITLPKWPQFLIPQRLSIDGMNISSLSFFKDWLKITTYPSMRSHHHQKGNPNKIWTMAIHQMSHHKTEQKPSCFIFAMSLVYFPGFKVWSWNLPSGFHDHIASPKNIPPVLIGSIHRRTNPGVTPIFHAQIPCGNSRSDSPKALESELFVAISNLREPWRFVRSDRQRIF